MATTRTQEIAQTDEEEQRPVDGSALALFLRVRDVMAGNHKDKVVVVVDWLNLQRMGKDRIVVRPRTGDFWLESCYEYDPMQYSCRPVRKLSLDDLRQLIAKYAITPDKVRVVFEKGQKMVFYRCYCSTSPHGHFHHNKRGQDHGCVTSVQAGYEVISQSEAEGMITREEAERLRAQLQSSGLRERKSEEQRRWSRAYHRKHPAHFPVPEPPRDYSPNLGGPNDWNSG